MKSKGEPAPRLLQLALLPPVILWTLPQTLVGFSWAIVQRLRGHPWEFYRFGPFIYLVVPTPFPGTLGISLGVVVYVGVPSILEHEFCHLITAMWLGWAYLPVYGLEYLIMGHDRSFHERITCRLEHSLRWRIRRLGR